MRIREATAKFALPSWLDGRTAVLVAIFGLLLTAYLDQRGELRAEFSAVRGEIASLRGELRAEIGGVRSELGTEIAQLRTELHDFRAEVRGDIARLDSGQRALVAEVGKLREDMQGLEVRLRAVEIKSASGGPRSSADRADESPRATADIGHRG